MPDVRQSKRESAAEIRRNANDALATVREAAELAGVHASLLQARSAAPEVARLHHEMIDTFFTRVAATAAAPSAARDHPRPQDDVAALRSGQEREVHKVGKAADQVNRILSAGLAVLERRQEADRAAPDAGGPGRAELDVRQQAQREELAALVASAAAGVERQAQDTRIRQREEQQEILQAVLRPDPRAELRTLAERQASDITHAARSRQRLVLHTKREMGRILDRLSQPVLDELRRATGTTTEGLDERAMHRIVDVARHKDQESRVNAVVGALAEEVNNARVLAAQAAGAHRDLVFFAGNRVTDGVGRQLTDGLLAARQGDHWKVVMAFEVKAGAPAADELDRAHDRDASPELLREARAEVAEDLLATRHGHAPADPAEGLAAAARILRTIPDAELEQLVAEKLTALRAPFTQAEAGQLSRTSERLSQQRLFVDGVELPQADAEHRRRVAVRAVLPRDARTDLDADRLTQTSVQLRAAAAALLDVLDRHRPR